MDMASHEALSTELVYAYLGICLEQWARASSDKKRAEWDLAVGGVQRLLQWPEDSRQTQLSAAASEDQGYPLTVSAAVKQAAATFGLDARVLREAITSAKPSPVGETTDVGQLAGVLSPNLLAQLSRGALEAGGIVTLGLLLETLLAAACAGWALTRFDRTRRGARWTAQVAKPGSETFSFGAWEVRFEASEDLYISWWLRLRGMPYPTSSLAWEGADLELLGVAAAGRDLTDFVGAMDRQRLSWITDGATFYLPSEVESIAAHVADTATPRKRWGKALFDLSPEELAPSPKVRAVISAASAATVADFNAAFTAGGRSARSGCAAASIIAITMFPILMLAAATEALGELSKRTTSRRKDQRSGWHA